MPGCLYVSVKAIPYVQSQYRVLKPVLRSLLPFQAEHGSQMAQLLLDRKYRREARRSSRQATRDSNSTSGKQVSTSSSGGGMGDAGSKSNRSRKKPTTNSSSSRGCKKLHQRFRTVIHRGPPDGGESGLPVSYAAAGLDQDGGDAFFVHHGSGASDDASREEEGGEGEDSVEDEEESDGSGAEDGVGRRDVDDQQGDALNFKRWSGAADGGADGVDQLQESCRIPMSLWKEFSAGQSFLLSSSSFPTSLFFHFSLPPVLVSLSVRASSRCVPVESKPGMC